MGEEDDEDGDVLWCTEMERYCRPPTKNKGLDTFLLGCLDFLITILMWLILVDVDVKDCQGKPGVSLLLDTCFHLSKYNFISMYIF